MADGQPTASTTKKDAAKPTDAKVAAKKTVTYLINTAASKAGINLAYAVAVDGKVLDTYASKVGKVKTDSGVGITATVESGKKVSLYLNSDSVPGRRNKPVYEVTVKDKNVSVTITEKLGKHNDPDTPTLVSSDKTTDRYKAPLTGDIWLKVTHKFTAADVDALVPAGTRADVTAAVKLIYAGLPSTSLVATIGGKSITFSFQGNENAKTNITSFSVTADGLPRVHPAAFAAVFTAASDANVSTVAMSSNWRPCLGSIAHRSGLGLDVTNVGGTQMLKAKGFNANEIQLLNAYKGAKEGPAKEKAKAAWQTEHDKNEPAHVQAFRASLHKNAGVKQVFDPWGMDSDTTDKVAATANTQGDANAKLHSNHLHVTARDSHLIM